MGYISRNIIKKIFSISGNNSSARGVNSSNSNKRNGSTVAKRHDYVTSFSFGNWLVLRAGVSQEVGFNCWWRPVAEAFVSGVFCKGGVTSVQFPWFFDVSMFFFFFLVIACILG